MYQLTYTIIIFIIIRYSCYDRRCIVKYIYIHYLAGDKNAPFIEQDQRLQFTKLEQN